MPQKYSDGRELESHDRRHITESSTTVPGIRASGKAAAMAAAQHGWTVFPCRPGDKRPAIDHWEQRACTDPERVARYWPSPRHNVGIACGPSRLVVVDLDSAAHGALPPDWAALPGIHGGRDVLAQVAEWAGEPWPCTYTVSTPSGGSHLYFTAPEASSIRNSAGKIGPLVDVRAQGGYVVGAGSLVGGRIYKVLDGTPPSVLPGWLHRLLTGPPATARAGRQIARGTAQQGVAATRLRGILRTVSTAPEGQRNSALHWGACRAAGMIAAGETDSATVVEALVTAAMAAGLPETEARRTVASGMQGATR
jgi:hypothetical protein